jgi:hypothetical protein
MKNFCFFLHLFHDMHIIVGIINKSRCAKARKKRRNRLKVTAICDNFLIQNVYAVDGARADKFELQYVTWLTVLSLQIDDIEQFIATNLFRVQNQENISSLYRVASELENYFWFHLSLFLWIAREEQTSWGNEIIHYKSIHIQDIRKQTIIEEVSTTII